MHQLKYLSGCLALICLVGAQSAAKKQIITPDGLKLIPRAGGESIEQFVRSSDGTLHMVFRAVKSDQAKTAVYYSRLDTAGAWSEPVQVSDDSQRCQEPVIALDGRRLLSAWIDSTDPRESALVIRISDDQGKSWSSVLRHPAGVSPSVVPRIAVSGNRAYLCFSSLAKGGVGERVYFLRSGDGGKTWVEKEVNFKQPRSYSSPADLLVRGDSVWLTWCDQDVRGVKRVVLTGSKDGGETWPAEPVIVSDPNPQTPSEVRFDDTQTGAVIVWRAVLPGRQVSIYEDSCQDGLSCGNDQLIFKSDVIPLTYRIVKCGNNRILLLLAKKGGLSEEQKQLYWLNIDNTPVSLTNQQVVVWPGAEHASFSEFDVSVTSETLYLAAVARFGRGDWRLLLLSRKADGEDLNRIIGGEERKERSSLALVPLNSDIGWLYQERRPRRLPMESPLSDALVFGRLGQDQ